MDVVDRLHLRILLQSDGIESGLLTRYLECGFETRQIVDRRSWPHVLVAIEQYIAELIGDR